jgi:hypothetical protein
MGAAKEKQICCGVATGDAERFTTARIKRKGE